MPVVPSRGNGQFWCIWRNYLKNLRLGREGVMDPTKSLDVSSKKKGKCGRKQKWDKEKLKEVKNIPLYNQQTLDQFAFCVGNPNTSLWRLLKDGKLKQHSSALKPLLTEKNKMEQLHFCFSFLRNDGFFDDMYSYVHIDEKWFYFLQN